MEGQAVVNLTEHKKQSGTKKNGKEWTRYIVKGSDGKTYSTFDDNFGAILSRAMGSGESLKLFYSTEQGSYQGKPFERHMINSVVPFTEIKESVKEVDRQNLLDSVSKLGKGNESDERSFWRKKSLLDFQRNGMMSCCKAASIIMASSIEAKIETYKFEDALKLTKAGAEQLYADLFARLETGEKEEGPDDQEDDGGEITF